MKPPTAVIVIGTAIFALFSPAVVAQDGDHPPQITPTSAEFERRDRIISEEDLRILLRADEILFDESVWNREDDRACDDDESESKWSLFCALQKACIEVLGTYDHRRAALQEVRFAIVDATNNQKFDHRLRDYNNLTSVQFEDVKLILNVAQNRVASRLAQVQSD